MVKIATAAAALCFTFALPAMADPSHCPPGHAKKGWCEAGEASSMGRSDDRVELDGEVRIIEDLDLYRLPPIPRGERYAVVGDRVVRVTAEDYTTIAVVGALSQLLVE